VIGTLCAFHSGDSLMTTVVISMALGVRLCGSLVISTRLHVVELWPLFVVQKKKFETGM